MMLTAFSFVQIFTKAEAEVKRLDQLKASRTKELFFKKQKELEDTCNISHMETPSTEMGNITNLVESGETNSNLLKPLRYLYHIYVKLIAEFSYPTLKGKLTMSTFSPPWMKR